MSYEQINDRTDRFSGVILSVTSYTWDNWDIRLKMAVMDTILEFQGPKIQILVTGACDEA